MTIFLKRDGNKVEIVLLFPFSPPLKQQSALKFISLYYFKGMTNQFL